MIEVGEEYRAAITAQSRRVLLRAAVDLISPNFTFGEVTASSNSSFSHPDQIHDRNKTLGIPGLTLEQNRWILGDEYTTNVSLDQEWGWESSKASNSSANISGTWVEIAFQNVVLLQSFSVHFPTDDLDGFPVNFTIEIKRDNVAVVTIPVTDNTQRDLTFTDFGEVNYPTSIRLTVSTWSLPYRRCRIPEIWPGSTEEWNDDMFASFDIQKKGSFTCLSLPYTTCSLTLDNSDRRFDPVNKAGLFRSLEDRQGIEVSISVNGLDYFRVGKFYQKSGGWATGNSALTIQWNLVDIVGLLIDRSIEIDPQVALPTTLDTWIQFLVSQLGVNFASMYRVQDEYKDISLTATKEEIQDLSCGDLLRYLCQATQTWPRASEDGKLFIGDLSAQNEVSSEITLDNLNDYPKIKANEDVARVDIALPNDETYSAIGTSSSSQNTISIDNPFIKTAEDAQKLATYILGFYGGNVVEITGRGDPAREIGDMAMVDIYPGSVVSARIVEDSVEITDKVLKNCKSKLLNIISGISDYDVVEVITEDKIFTVPNTIELVTEYSGELHLILIGSGESGGHGSWIANEDVWAEPPRVYQGDPGDVGNGGRIFFDTIYVNRGETFQITIGRAAEPKSIYGETSDDTTVAIGTPTTFGPISSANGITYEKGYIDPISAKVFGRAGRDIPVENSGDGGMPGVGIIPETDDTWGVPPTMGVKGADGCVVIYYKTE